jgi:ribosomal protein S3AE
MIKINNINFTQKTIESIQIDGDDIKEINFEFHEREFKLRIIKDIQEIIEEVIEEKPNKDVVEEVIEEETPEEVSQEPKTLTLGEVKKIIYDTIP